ncbi:Uncharacterised protein g11380 [Pycnogonum litorale]
MISYLRQAAFLVLLIFALSIKSGVCNEKLSCTESFNNFWDKVCVHRNYLLNDTTKTKEYSIILNGMIDDMRTENCGDIPVLPSYFGMDEDSDCANSINVVWDNVCVHRNGFLKNTVETAGFSMVLNGMIEDMRTGNCGDIPVLPSYLRMDGEL